MHDKLATVRRLMREGYELEDIDSDTLCVEARFSRAGRRATVRLFASDAEKLLFPHANGWGLLRVRR